MLLYALLGTVGGVVVTLTAAIVIARRRLTASAAKASAALTERQRAADVLQITVREQATRIRDLEVQLREIDAVRSTRTALSTELERARQELATAVKAEAEARETARLAEERLQSESMVGRRTAAADRAVQDAQLRAAQQMAESLRGALAAERDSAARARLAVEAERDRMRASYESELVTARAALRRVEAEWVGLQTELAEVRHDVEVRSRDLESERRNAAAVEAALRAELAAGREERGSAVAGRETLTRELAVYRDRVQTLERAVQQLRADAAARIAAEHRRGMDLVNRIWSFASPAPAAQPAQPAQPAPAPVAAVATAEPPPQALAVPASTAAPTPPPAAAPSPAPAPTPSPSPAPSPTPSSPPEAQAGPQPEAPAATPPASPSLPSTPFSPSSPSPVEREVERPVERETAPLSPPDGTNGRQSIGRDAPTRDATAADGADIALTVHRLPPHLRKPVAVLREEGEAGGALILCNDGSVWEHAGGGAWREVTPLPGSQRDAVQKFYSEVAAPHQPSA